MSKATGFLSQTSGKLDDNFQTRQTDHGTILARNPRKTATTRRSEKQANTRCQLPNAAANFRLFNGKLNEAFENKSAGVSDFNCFVQANYGKNPVYITKQECAGASWCHSRNKADGGTQVSTQRLVVVSDILADYQGRDAMLASAESYGGINTKNVYLNPESTQA